MTWICKPTAGHEKHGQSVVYDEDTGRNIAIVYDGSADGSMIAAAPDLLKVCQMVELACENVGIRLEKAFVWSEGDGSQSGGHGQRLSLLNTIRAAIAKAEDHPTRCETCGREVNVMGRDRFGGLHPGKACE